MRSYSWDPSSYREPPLHKRMHKLRYFVKWKGCTEDENTWEPPESMEYAQEEVERFYRENSEMPSRAEVE